MAVRGIGGVFFKSQDPEALTSWYEKHLGIASKPGEGAMFSWRRADDPDKEEVTVWSVFDAHSKYFDPSSAPFMMNFIVDDLDATLAGLRDRGVRVDDKVERHDYGNFGWIFDPDGNKIELWEPKPPAT